MTLLLVAALGLSVAAPDAGARAADRDGEAAVAAAFKAYQAALLAKNGPRAAATLARPTVAYYQRMRDLAMSGKAADIKKLTIGDKLTILRLRVEFSAPELKRLDGAGVIAYSVQHGWVGDEVARVGVGAVVIDGERATIAALADGKPSADRFPMVRENGAWRLDLVPLMAGANAYFKKAAAESGMSEDDFVLMILERMSDRPVSPAIWNPPK